MVFENPHFLLTLLVLILVAGLGFWGWKAKKGIMPLFKLNLEQGKKSQLKKYLLAGAMMVLTVLALAQPRVFFPIPGTAEKTGEIILMVDVSESMAARENLDSPNRLERTKVILYEIIENFPEAEFYPFKFRDKARSFTPPVTKEDFPYLQRSIARVLEINSAPGEGTSLGRAICDVLEKISDGEEAKVIVLFSDGELFDWQRGMSSTEEFNLKRAIKGALRADVKIITVGVGELDGATIPRYDSNGEFTGEYAQLQKQTYVSYLEDEILKRIAAETGGEYFFETDRRGIINCIEKNLTFSGATKEQEESRDVSYLFIIPLVVLWAIFAKYYFK